MIVAIRKFLKHFAFYTLIVFSMPLIALAVAEFGEHVTVEWSIFGFMALTIVMLAWLSTSAELEDERRGIYESNRKRIIDHIKAMQRRRRWGES